MTTTILHNNIKQYLPDELWLLILAYRSTEFDWICTSFTLVCKRFYALKSKVMYIQLMRQCNFMQFTHTQLTQLKQLKSLKLSGEAYSVSLGDEGAVGLAYALNATSDDQAVGASNALQRHLQELDLRSNDIGPVGASALAQAIAKLHKLRVLNLQYNVLGAEGAQLFASALDQLRYLQVLDLRGIKMEDQGTMALINEAVFSQFKQLQVLDLSGNYITIDSIQAVTQALANTGVKDSLKELYLGYNSLRAAGTHTLATNALVHLRQLEVLELSYVDMEMHGLSALASTFCHLVKLKQLDLSYNEITPDGAKVLAPALSHLVQLRSFDVRGNKLKDQGTHALLPMILQHLTQLKHLNLRNNNISNNGLASIAEKFNGKEGFTLLINHS